MDEVLLGGIEKREIVIVDYDPRWPEKFQKHAGILSRVLGGKALAIERVGSTSVPEHLGQSPRAELKIVKKSLSNKHGRGDCLYVQRKYILDEHPHAFHLTLRVKGEDWQKEFASVGDAVAYAGSLPDSEDATLAVFNSSGGQLVELRVKDEVLVP